MAEKEPDSVGEGLGVRELQSLKKIVITDEDAHAIALSKRVAALISSHRGARLKINDSDVTLDIARRVNEMLRSPAGRQDISSQGTPITGASIRETQDFGAALSSVLSQPSTPPNPSMATDPTIDASEVHLATVPGMPGARGQNTAPVVTLGASSITATSQVVAQKDAYAALIESTKKGATPSESASSSEIISQLSDARWGPLLTRVFASYLVGSNKVSPIEFARKVLAHPSFSVLNSENPTTLMDSARSLSEFCIRFAMARCRLDESGSQHRGVITLSDMVTAEVIFAQNRAIVLGAHKVPVTTLAVKLGAPLFSVNIGLGEKADLDIIRIENFIEGLPEKDLLAREKEPVSKDGETRNADFKIWYESSQLQAASAEVTGTNPLLSYRNGGNAMHVLTKNDAVYTWIVMRWLTEVLRHL